MINVHHVAPGGAVVDEAALEQFQKQWATYQKLVDNDSLASRESCAILRAALAKLAGPFAFLDIACGDAGQMKQALAGTIDHHVTTCDFPETAATWLDLGRQAGFSKAESPFLDPTGFYAIYRYDR